VPSSTDNPFLKEDDWTMTDVAVIGAGPAGAMAAGMLAQRGYRVRVL
jgi:ribulose 1,5-bisphosphate synthetase/thiazole synthase